MINVPSPTSELRLWKKKSTFPPTNTPQLEMQKDQFLVKTKLGLESEDSKLLSKDGSSFALEYVFVPWPG